MPQAQGPTHAASALPGAVPSGEVVLQCDRLHLDPSPESIGQARSFVVEHAPAVDDDTVDVLRLLTSELVTNAVMHAQTTVDVEVLTTARVIVVTVEDMAPEGPSLHSAEREGGRGLGLVASLAQEWAIVYHPDVGKTAWFRLPR